MSYSQRDTFCIYCGHIKYPPLEEVHISKGLKRCVPGQTHCYYNHEAAERRTLIIQRLSGRPLQQNCAGCHQPSEYLNDSIYCPTCYKIREVNKKK